MFRHVGIIANSGSRTRNTVRQVADLLAARHVEASISEDSAWLLDGEPALPALPVSDLGARADLVIVIGGDGTMLKAARMLADHDVHLLGINLGRLGFLTDLSPDRVPDGITPLLDGQCVVERRALLQGTVERDDRTIGELLAFNDIVVQKVNVARLIAFETWINDVFVHSQRSDGLIVSTPTGSTAYSLSGGGPILHPGLRAISLVPICPHSLSQRPIVVSDDSRISVVLGAGEYAYARLSCDGDEILDLTPGDVVRIGRHPRGIKLIHPLDHDHFATLRRKLHWGRELGRDRDGDGDRTPC